MEPSLPHLARKDIGKGHERHAHVMGHVVLDDREALTGIGPGVVDGVAESIGPECTQLLLGP